MYRHEGRYLAFVVSNDGEEKNRGCELYEFVIEAMKPRKDDVSSNKSSLSSLEQLAKG